MSSKYLDDVFTLKDLVGSTLTENLVFLFLFQVPHLR